MSVLPDSCDFADRVGPLSHLLLIFICPHTLWHWKTYVKSKCPPDFGSLESNLVNHQKQDTMLRLVKWYYLGEMFYVCSASVLRVSIAFLLLRISKTPWMRAMIWVVMFISTLAGIVTTAELTFQCQPISYFWNVSRDPVAGHCIDSRVTTIFGYTHAAASCVSDWTLGVLPWLIVRDITSRKQKIQVACLLCFANFGSVATTIRFATIHQLNASEDFLYDSVPLAVWSAAEVGTGLSAASIATFYPLWKWIVEHRKEPNKDPGQTRVERIDEFQIVTSKSLTHESLF